MKSFHLFLLYSSLVLVLAGISSCKYVYFDQPLPVGAKNLKEIPLELRGKWSAAKERQDTILITNSSFISIVREHHIIYNYQADTTPNYILIDDKIFFYEDLSTGFPFTLQDSDLLYQPLFKYVITLSDTAILRKCKDSFVINLKRGQWWEMMYIRKKEDGEIDIFYPHYDRMKEMKEEIEFDVVNLFENTSNETTGSDTVYIDARWKAQDIDRLFSVDSLNIVLYKLLPDSTFLYLEDNQ